MDFDFLLCLLALLEFYLVGVGAFDDPLLSRGEHCSPAKKHKITFLLSYFCVTKRRVQGGEATSERRRRDEALWVWSVRGRDGEMC